MNAIFQVTLSDLRKARACISGYNKAVRGVQGAPFTKIDTARNAYIRFAHRTPIQLVDILKSNGVDDALWALRCVPNAGRDARMYAVWCARQVQHLMNDKRSLAALDAAERFANGEASLEELFAAWDAARDAAWDAARDAAWDAARDAQSKIFIAMCEGRAPWQN